MMVRTVKVADWSARHQPTHVLHASEAFTPDAIATGNATEESAAAAMSSPAAAFCFPDRLNAPSKSPSKTGAIAENRAAAGASTRPVVPATPAALTSHANRRR